MSRPQGPQKPFLQFGNPFRMISPKGTHLSPKLVALLNAFEETLALRIRNLKPASRDDILRFSWMIHAMETLRVIHSDIKNLITGLDLPVCDWDDKWIDVYLDNSVKLLDICIAFSSEISRFKHGHLFLQCILHNLDGASQKQLMRSRSSIDEWKHHISQKNPRLDNCFSVMDSLVRTLDLPKVKNSAMGKVLMRAMYGVKVVTISVCSIFAAAFSGSANKLMDLQVSDTHLWAEAFVDLQSFVNTEIRSVYTSGSFTVLKELEAVDTCIKKMCPILPDESNHARGESQQGLTSDLGKSAENLSQGLDLLAKEVDRFFRIVLTGRDALLSNLRVDGNFSDKVRAANNAESPKAR